MTLYSMFLYTLIFRPLQTRTGNCCLETANLGNQPVCFWGNTNLNPFNKRLKSNYTHVSQGIKTTISAPLFSYTGSFSVIMLHCVSSSSFLHVNISPVPSPLACLVTTLLMITWSYTQIFWLKIHSIHLRTSSF